MNDRPRDEEVIGLVPAAGKGSRLALPYPKELYPIIRDNQYKPVAQHVLENMLAAGIDHVVFVVNETKHQLIGFFGSGRRFGCDLSYAVQEPLEATEGGSAGLAEALDAGYHLVRGKTVVFGMADTIVQPVDSFAHMFAAEHGEADVVLGLFETEHPHLFGMVDHDDRGRVREIVDKPSRTELRWMWGCILWRPRFTEFLHESLRGGGPSDFASILNAAGAEGLDLRAVRIDGADYLDVGTYENLQRLDREFRH